MKRHAIILYDGDCLFCHKSVRFIIKHDQAAYFLFTSLEGQTGTALKKQHNIPDTLDSLVLIENDSYYDASTAALRISKRLGGIYKLGVILLLIPKPLRDAVYHSIAKRRHRLFNQSACSLPTSEERKRSLD